MRKSIIAIAIFFALTAGGGIVASYLIKDTYWQALVMGLSVSFVQLVLGILIVNLYLDKKGKKNMARAFLSSSDHRIAIYHNTFLELIWAEFGQKQWSDLVDSYIKGNGNPSTISAEEKNRVFNVVKNNHVEIYNLVRNAGEQMSEISKSGALSFDEDLHSHTWAAKEVAKKLLRTDINSSHANVNDVFECCIDFDIHTQIVRSILYKLAEK